MAHYNLGNAYYMMNQPKQSITAYKNCLKVKEQSPECHFNLASAYLELGEFNKALHHFKSCIKFDKHNADAYFNMGKILEKEDKTKDEARKAFEKTLKINPNHEKAKEKLSKLF